MALPLQLYVHLCMCARVCVHFSCSVRFVVLRCGALRFLLRQMRVACSGCINKIVVKSLALVAGRTHSLRNHTAADAATAAAPPDRKLKTDA